MRQFNTAAEIKAERELQRSNSVVYSLLGVLLGELDRLPIPRSQEPTKDQIYDVVRKLHEGALLLSSKDLSEEAKIEYAYLKDFIKQQLSIEEIEDIVKGLHLNFPSYNIGQIMKYFKDTYPGQYDGKIVSQVAKSVLNN